jgi:CRISPR-associated endoribonuclease Cas6
MQHKLAVAGLPQDISIAFDRTYHKAKTKLVSIKGIQSRANECPVIIKGAPELINFAWNVGIGHSTGSGFGALN